VSFSQNSVVGEIKHAHGFSSQRLTFIVGSKVKTIGEGPVVRSEEDAEFDPAGPVSTERRLARFIRYVRSLGSVKKYLLYSLTILCVFLLLGAAKLSTASLPFSSDGNDDARVLSNAVRTTRSDDFLRGIPRWLSYQRDGIPDSALDFSNSAEFTNMETSNAVEIVERVVLLPDDVIQKVLNQVAPLEVRFSIREWFVYLRIFLVVPLFFMCIGYRLSTGFIASLLISLTPLSLWFGGSPAAMTAAVFLPLTFTALFVQVFNSRLAWRRTCLVLLATYAAVTAFTAIEYPPWKWPLLMVFGTLLLSTLVSNYGWRSLVKPFLVLFILGGGYQLARWFAYNEQYTATLNTVYPGKRRAEGGGGYGNPMSGAVTWLMQTSSSRQLSTVSPEVAFSLNAMLWPVFVAAPLLLARHSEDRRIKPFLVALVPVGVLMLWVGASWPDLFLKYNPLTLVPTERAGQILGVIALLLIVTLSEIRSSLSLGTRCGLGMLAFLLVCEQSIGDSLDRIGSYFTQFPSTTAWILVIALGVCAGFFFIAKHPVLALIPVLIFTVLSSYKIQPITVGLGPLVGSPLATEIRTLRSSAPDAYWGSDPFWADALVMAQGVNMLSGQQPFGPNKAAWHQLDPQEKNVDVWNRGQSYIHFIWDANEPQIRFSNPSPDVISVVVSPCSPLIRTLKLKYVLTSMAPGPCMKLVFTGVWMATPVGIYEVSGT